MCYSLHMQSLKHQGLRLSLALVLRYLVDLGGAVNGLIGLVHRHAKGRKLVVSLAHCFL